MTERLLVALDIDGTVLMEDGEISDAVHEQVSRVRDAGHEVMLATGRAPSMTLPVLERLELTSEYIVCSNGAVTLRRDPDAPVGYARDHVETFDPTAVLLTVREHLKGADFAVEDEHGLFKYTGWFSNGTVGATAEKVDFEELLNRQATRVVVISPEHEVKEFLHIVERMGLHQVSYNVGWTAWLDIAPDGVNKATALERVRESLGIRRGNVIAIGDGRNDIDMLRWASENGHGVAMGQAPEEVREVANTFTAHGDDDGVALILEELVPGRLASA
ncbi:HAD family hydrolase [Ruicaihuangia caeni]|uniref:Cof-type HAD-IIB family hydrolase n=1 Tax=Ruicaihuangia caeni TaxID=3042517 RepID=A0AAW6T551_9MICO|nr:Cof-type HAD-IIB family hydrolase [Klugiella sp. YN-L-19]MDI2098961.1 Cof-type HAD-IIB family hydrolase [Klugiella sp. YN-L-19]